MESDACPSISLINHSEEVKFDNTLSPTNSYEVENLEKNNAIISSMPKYGEPSIKLYIAECANILKRHPQVLSGDVSLFEKKEPFTELKIQIYRRDKDGKVIKDGIRTVKSLSELNDLKTQKENFLTRLLSRIKNYFT
jgi:RecB family endonuclease NucS